MYVFKQVCPSPEEETTAGVRDTRQQKNSTTLIRHTVKSLPLESLKEQYVVLDKTFKGVALLMRQWNKLRSVYLCP